MKTTLPRTVRTARQRLSFCLRIRPYVLLILLAVLSLGAPFTSNAQDVLTYHNDNARTGLDSIETILTPANVNSASFGLLFVINVDGKVDAQPLYVSNLAISNGGNHNVLFVATEHASVYAFDADTGAALWQVSLLKPGERPSDPPPNCDQVVPEIGITATPVIDRSSGPHGSIYVVVMSKDSSRSYHQRLHALDITTGQEEFGGPVEIQATYPGTGDESQNGAKVFDPKQHKERAGLLLLNHVVYVSWSSHCDFGPYTGWVMAYNESSLVQTAVLNLAPNGSGNSIWQSDTAPAADSNGHIYFMTANGTFDTTLDAQGFPSKGDYGNAFVKLSQTPSGLPVTDYFTMSNTTQESNADEDLGSGGVLLLPDLTDAQGGVHQLAVGAGKDQIIYVVDRNNMGKFSPTSDNDYQELPSSLNGSEFGMPAYFNNTVYFGASGDTLSAFPIANAKLEASPSSTSSTTFAYPGTTPSISANGTSNAIVWAAENTDPAVLHAYDATDLSRELYNSNQAAGGRDHFGTGNKFITPMIANGKVYVGTTNGVGVFGLLTAGATLSPANLTFSGQVVGTSSAAETVTFTNGSSAALTISSISAGGDFAETNTCGSSLAAASSCTINVTFKPAAGGNRSGSLTVKYGASGAAQSVALSGVGEDFSIVAASGSSTSATVSPGQTATYSLSVAPAGGFSQTVTFACTGAPSEAACSVSPSSIALSGTSALSVTVTTAAPSLAGPSPASPDRGARRPVGLWLLALWLAALFALRLLASRRPRLSVLALAALTLSLIALVSCGGGSGSTAVERNPGTPAGTYTLTVTGTYASGSASLSHSEPLQLTVQ